MAAAAAAAAGGTLLVWTVRSAGTASVFEGVRRVGAGFAAVLLLGGARYLLRALAWQLAIEPPDRLPLRTAFAAVVGGDAIGNATPLGVLISEPSKVALARRAAGVEASIAGLAVENLFYGASVVMMLAVGTPVLLLSVHPGPAIRAASLATLGAALAAAAAGGVAVWMRAPLLTRVLDWAVRFESGRRLERHREQARRIEDRIYRFAARHPRRLAPLAALEAAYHALAVFEVWLTLALIAGGPPRALTAFVLEYANRAITIAFQAVPLWLGVDEAGTGLVARALAFDAASGVSLALVRKARIATWTAAGLVAAARGLAPGPAADRTDPL